MFISPRAASALVPGGKGAKDRQPRRVKMVRLQALGLGHVADLAKQCSEEAVGGCVRSCWTRRHRTARGLRPPSGCSTAAGAGRRSKRK